MNYNPTQTMRGVVIDSFGAADALRVAIQPVPLPTATQVVLQVHTAGVGRWDEYERMGLFAELTGEQPQFPHRLGSEGSGTVVAIGEDVTRHKVGDHVYGLVTLRTPKDGFYADFVAVEQDRLWSIPSGLSMTEAGALASNGGTALRGLQDILHLSDGETALVHGASGGMGHLAVQLAKGMGATVVAIASGADGVALAERLGSDVTIDGRSELAMERLTQLGRERIDAALITGGGEIANRIVSELRPGCRVAVPNGVFPSPEAPAGVQLAFYNADYDDDLMIRLGRFVEQGSLRVEVSQLLTLEQASLAHHLMEKHTLGRIALSVSS